MSFFEELKRRNVFRVGVAYLIVAWLTLQVTDIVVPILELPDAFSKGVLLLLAVGFPVAIVLAWAFELTPEGVKKEKDVDRSASITQHSGRKLNTVIISVLSLAVVIFALDKFVWTSDEPPAPAEGSEAVAALDTGPKTIAVLPFVNMSDDSDQEYFSDGLSEELLNLLAKIPELRVTSRTSAFSFKDKDFTIAEVGEQLDVDHVLEGSVRRSGDTIRITAQLIEVATDAHRWSDTWDRQFEDVFVIQDEIAAHVVDALRIQLLTDIPKAEVALPEAHALVLQGSFLFRQRNAPSIRQAIELLEQAVALDPDYSQAWVWLAIGRYVGTAMGVGDRVEAVPIVQEALDNALAADSNNASAYVLRAQIAYEFDYDLDRATELIEIAEELQPWNSQVHRLAGSLDFAIGDVQKSVEHREFAHELDPLAGHRRAGARVYYYAGHVEEALQYFEEGAELRPFGERAYSDWARVVLLEGDPEGALALVDNEASDGHRTAVRALAYQTMGDTERAYEELENLVALGIRWTFEIAEVYAFLGDADEAFAWFDRAIERRDASLAETVTDPFLDGIRDDPRFDELLERLGRKQSL